jgi:predicted AlkP superfamily pyrophosphatase or phosphodiesterase
MTITNTPIRLIFLLLGWMPFYTAAQKKTAETPPRPMPSLVVGIVVDQMRFDYINRFWSKYSEDGFRRLVNGGFSFANAKFSYLPTNTAPGHACIYTGTGPANNGIINNEWYDRAQRKTIYCVGDTGVSAVGTTSISGKMSPRNLISTTMTDELRLASNMRSKVIAIALKDRGAVLPAGHSGIAYWHDPYLNNWVTSTYYMEKLPVWAKAFNERKMADSLLSEKWNTLLPIEEYVESAADNNPHEGLFEGETKPVFPHDLPRLKEHESELIRATPMGNTFTKEFAIAALKGENLGRGEHTDFLAVSFSSTDYIGHMYGIHAIELQDAFLRLDRDIADLLKFLDGWAGSDYLVFLTSDHGAAQNPFYSSELHIHAGMFTTSTMSESLRAYLSRMYKTDSLVGSVSAHNIFLNRDYIHANKLDLKVIQDQCAEFVKRFDGVALTMPAHELEKGLKRTGMYAYIQNGFHPTRSSDVAILLKPGWLSWYRKTGTSHGTPYSYDTHVPLIFFGHKIRKGLSHEDVFIDDIAPTISSLLGIEFPSACTGRTLIHHLH